MKILQAHPRLSILHEPFNENRAKWGPNSKNYRALVHDIPSLDEQLSEIFTAYNGLKMLEYQLPDALNVHLLQRPDCKIIFLRRRNLLQAVVSVKIAIQSNIWQKSDLTQSIVESYRTLLPLDIADIQHRVTDLRQHLDFLEAVIDARPDKAVVKLTYEDLYFAAPASQQQQLAAIWELLDLRPPPLEELQPYLRPEEVKINSGATYALLPNAAEIQRLCGSDETGWLFE